MSLGLSGIIPILLVLYFLLEDHLSKGNWILGTFLILLCLALGFFMLRDSAKQLKSLAQETEAIKDGNQLYTPGELWKQPDQRKSKLGLDVGSVQ